MSLGNVHLTPQLVQAVRDRADVVEVASRHTKLRKAGRRMQGLCPLHKEKTPSFSVDPERGLFYCFGCGAGGDAIKLHQLLTGDDFPAAIEVLAEQYGIPLPTAPAGRRAPEGTAEVLAAAQELFVAQLERAEMPRRYLAERAIPEELWRRYGLGYATPGWTDLVERLGSRVGLKKLEQAGLVGRSRRSGDPYDRFRNRLIFPIHSPTGRLVGFGGRTLGDDRAKYVNTAETESFHKGRLLYGLHLARPEIRENQGQVVLVEGYFDLLALAAVGHGNVVAGMGTALTPEQARLLQRFADRVVLCYDGDEAGVKAARRALPLLLAEGLEIARVELPPGQDPDSLRLEEGAESLRQRVAAAPDAVDAEVRRLVPEGRGGRPQLEARAAGQVAELLGAIRDPVLRHGYGRLAADRLWIPVEVLWKRLRQPGPVRPQSESAPAAPREVLGLEERVLQLLLETGADPPPPEELPEPEVFHDPVCRNIFALFRDIYARDGVSPPGRELLSRLDPGEPVDRLARLLVQGAGAVRAGELTESLSKLRRRRRQQRLRELAREIAEAQRVGDASRMDRLLQEKTQLSRELHLDPERTK